MPFDSVEADSDLPDIDDRLVEPGTRYEMYDGVLVYVAPADGPHGERQSQLCTLLEAHIGAQFKVASEVLTRTSKVDDVAPDASVYPAARDPHTGRRQLPQLAFEVVSTQRLANAARKAAKLAGRGVRRIFAIDIERSRALEWLAALGTWSVLDAGSHIVDPALAVPLPIDTLIHEANSDDAVVRAMSAKRNPVMEAIRAEERTQGLARGLAQGHAEGLGKAVITVLATRGVLQAPDERARILSERDLARLERWLVQAMSCATAADLFLER